jgi:acetyl-CoA C-acetyltransferase
MRESRLRAGRELQGTTTVDTDESPRKDTSVEALSKLRPAFPNKDGSTADLTVTAGNAPGLNDGGAALVVASEAYAKAHGLPILARIDAYATGATEPEDLFFAPILAVRNLMAKESSKIGDFDLIEANEAFASQSLADGEALGWDGTGQREWRRHRARSPDQPRAGHESSRRCLRLGP